MDPHLTNEDVADILALLDSLSYDEFDLETPRFRLTLRRTPAGWTQSTQVPSAPEGAAVAPVAAPEGAASGVRGPLLPSIGGEGTLTPVEGAGSGDGEADEVDEVEEGDGGLVAVRAPLPGTFYRAPRPGAAPFVEVGGHVGADTVIGIVETMKLMNSVSAGVAGVVAEFCAANAELVAQGAALLRIRAGE
jgi:acetyl-CoA carboxylase biotin carboxyl carrier protein